jgi:hypothetical protein
MKECNGLMLVTPSSWLTNRTVTFFDASCETRFMVDDAFEAFLLEPTREAYRRACRLIMQAPDFGGRSSDLWPLMEGLKQGREREVLDLCDEYWPQWRLSPRFHRIVGIAAERLELADEVELAKFQFRSCLQGILETGKGTARSPLQVMFACDECDVLMALGLEAAVQQVVQRGTRFLDVVTSKDNREVWFEVAEFALTEQPAKLDSFELSRIPRELAWF